MRLSAKKSLLTFYIMTCSLITLLNYRYSLVRIEPAQEAEDSPEKPSHQVVKIDSLRKKIEKEFKSTPKSSVQSGDTDGVYFRILSYAVDSANRTLQRIMRSAAAPFRKDEKPTEYRVPLYPEDSLETDRIIEQLKFKPTKLKDGVIKIYLNQGIGAWHVKSGKREFEANACPVQNCQLTGNRADAASADAIIFRQHVNPPPIGQRRPEQIWIYYNLESPDYSGNYQNSVINWTATYRWDSDLVAPYERYTPLRDIPSDQLLDVQNRFSTMLRPYKAKFNYAKGKTKKVAWFVSHCSTTNKRERYVRELSNHIPVDTFGACGPLKCSRFSKRCDDMLDKDYKFYIAFENSNCKDYVTEKYFINGLGRDIIPILMGARKSEYAKMSPPNSFIHVDDFKDPKSLADYLHHLDSNDTAYNEYFKWKGQGAFINTKFWCRLCAMLNNPKPKVYQNLQAWWNSPGTCIKGQWPN